MEKTQATHFCRQVLCSGPAQGGGEIPPSDPQLMTPRRNISWSEKAVSLAYLPVPPTRRTDSPGAKQLYHAIATWLPHLGVFSFTSPLD